MNYLLKKIKQAVLGKAKAKFSIANYTIKIVLNLKKKTLVFKRSKKYNKLEVQVMVLMILLINS